MDDSCISLPKVCWYFERSFKISTMKTNISFCIAVRSYAPRSVFSFVMVIYQIRTAIKNLGNSMNYSDFYGDSVYGAVHWLRLSLLSPYFHWTIVQTEHALIETLEFFGVGCVDSAEKIFDFNILCDYWFKQRRNIWPSGSYNLTLPSSFFVSTFSALVSVSGWFISAFHFSKYNNLQQTVMGYKDKRFTW